MSPTVDDLLSQFSIEVQDLAQRTRKLVREIVPDTQETVSMGHQTIAYGAGAKMGQQFCYISPHKAHANLGFHRGAVLPDPNGLLEGTGKLLRHVKIKSAADLDKPGLRDLILAALAEHNRV